MKCPKCLGRMKVLRSRENIEDGEVYREQKCMDCGYETQTVEFEVDRDKTFLKHWHRCALNKSGLPCAENEKSE